MVEKRFYSKEFKQEVLDKVKSGTRATEVAQVYGINVKRIYKWASDSVNANPSVIELSRLKRENQALKELVGELTLNLNRLKKR